MGDLDSQTRPKAVTDGHIYKGFPKRSFDETAGRSDWELAPSLRRERRLLKSDWHLGLPQIRQAILHQSPSSFRKLCRTQCGLFEHTLILWLAQTKNCGFFRYRLISLRSHGRLTNENQEQHSSFLALLTSILFWFGFLWGSWLSYFANNLSSFLTRFHQCTITTLCNPREKQVKVRRRKKQKHGSTPASLTSRERSIYFTSHKNMLPICPVMQIWADFSRQSVLAKIKEDMLMDFHVFWAELVSLGSPNSPNSLNKRFYFHTLWYSLQTQFLATNVMVFYLISRSKSASEVKMLRDDEYFQNYSN